MAETDDLKPNYSAPKKNIYRSKLQHSFRHVAGVNSQMFKPLCDALVALFDEQYPDIPEGATRRMFAGRKIPPAMHAQHERFLLLTDMLELAARNGYGGLHLAERETTAETLRLPTKTKRKQPATPALALGDRSVKK